MNQIQKLMRRGQATLVKFYPCSVIYDGLEYEGSTAGADSQQTLIAGGLTEDVEFVVRIDKIWLPEKPKEGQRITCAGTDYRIGKIRGSSSSDVVWTIDCKGEDSD